jgi:hypothetical protein
VKLRPYATHPKDREFFRGVLAALSIAKSDPAAAAAVAKIIATVGEADLRERARLDGTEEYAGLAGTRPAARSARTAPRLRRGPGRSGREKSGGDGRVRG